MAKQSKSLATSFTVGKTMETEIRSDFMRGAAEGAAKRQKKSAGSSSHGAMPSPSSIFGELTGLPMDLVSSSSALQARFSHTKSSRVLPDSNVGFKLLKKSGWKEGSGLGVSEQGRLDPLETQFKTDRSGIGAEKKAKKIMDSTALQDSSSKDEVKKSKREKSAAKRLRKLKAEAERTQEQAMVQDFYRAFWPENV